MIEMRNVPERVIDHGVYDLTASEPSNGDILPRSHCPSLSNLICLELHLDRPAGLTHLLGRLSRH